MDEFIHWLKSYVLLPTTRDEMLLWMIEIWMQNHLVSAGDCSTINLQSPNFFFME